MDYINHRSPAMADQQELTSSSKGHPALLCYSRLEEERTVHRDQSRLAQDGEAQRLRTRLTKSHYSMAQRKRFRRRQKEQLSIKHSLHFHIQQLQINHSQHSSIISTKEFDIEQSKQQIEETVLQHLSDLAL